MPRTWALGDGVAGSRSVHVTLCSTIHIRSGDEVWHPTLRGAQGRVAFAHLLLERARPISRDRLADVIWDGGLPSSWESALDALVSRTRNVFRDAGLDGRSIIELRDGSYHVTLPGTTTVDVEEVERLLDVASDADTAGDTSAAAEAAAGACALVGDLLPGDTGEWLERRRDQMRSNHRRALLILGTSATDRTAATSALESAIALDPYDERTSLALAERLIAWGEPVEALAVLDRAARTATEDLGVPASSTLTELRARAVAALGGPVAAGIVCVGFAAPPASSPDTSTVSLLESIRLGPVPVTARNLGGGVAFIAPSAPEGFAVAHATAGGGARVALHLGDPMEHEAAWSGEAVATARRLARRDREDGVVVTDPVRALLQDDVETWADAGDIALGEDRHRVQCWRSSGPPRLRLPELPSTCNAPGNLVGRDRSLADLDEVILSASRGDAAVAVVTGEAGIGKTSVLHATLRSAHDRDTIVLLGRCRASGRGPYRPIIEALHPAFEQLNQTELTRVTGRQAPVLGRLVPALRGRIAHASSPVGTEPEARRFELREGVRLVLAALARERPVVLALDDVQWADEATLELAEHLLDRTVPGLAIVMTYRDDGDRGNGGLEHGRPVIDVLRSHKRTQRIELLGLDSDEISAMVFSGGTQPLARTRQLSHQLAELTGGNPFFVRAIVEGIPDVDDEGELPDLPDSVRAALASRFRSLDASILETLRVAAVVGQDVEVELLAAVAGLSADVVVDLLDAARRTGVVADSPRGHDWFTFTHPLLVEALAADVSLARRARLHERIADAIEAVGGGDRGQVTELAHHLLSASNRVEPDRTERWTRRAAAEAESEGAYAVAASLYRRLLAQRRPYVMASEGTDASLHLALGRACNRAGDVPGAIQALLAVRQLAGPDGEALQAAAMELGWEWSLQFDGGVDESVVSLVSDALDSLGSRRTREWARIACIRAEHLYYADPEAANELAREALGVARAEADPAAIAEALRRHASFAHVCDTDLSERVALLEESAQIFEQAGEVLRAQANRVHEGGVRLQMGDAEGFRRIAQELHRFAERYPSPRLRYFDATWQGMLAMQQRRDDDAERAIDTAALVRGRNFPLSLDYPFFQRALLRHRQGRTNEVEAALGVAAEFVPISAVRASHALARATIGEHDKARQTARELCADGLAAVPRDYNFVLTLAFLAETVHTLADLDLARQLLPCMAAYTGQIAVVGFGAATLGPIDAHLARLHHLLGNASAASQLRSTALDLAAQLEDDSSAERIRRERSPDRS